MQSDMETFGQVPVDAPPDASNKTRRPHRPRKDYTNLETLFDSLDDLKTALRLYMDNATADAAPGYVSCAMTLSSHAILPLKSPLEGPYAQGGPNFLTFDVLGSSNGGNDNVPAPEMYPTRTVQDLVDILDLKERQIWQRAAAKGVVNAIQDLDGFKYCFNNNWTSKDDNGYRYSYTCLDSLENKDRHANGFRATNAAKRRPGANTRGVRKPTYDCKGQIAVKFSGVRQSVEVVYKHHPIHKTVAERRPPPRKDPKRLDQSGEPQLDDSTSFDFDAQNDNSYLFEDTPELNMSSVAHDASMSTDMQSAPYADYADDHQPPAAKKARRKTKEAGPPKPKRQKKQKVAQSEDRPMSLAEILQQSMKGAPGSSPARPPPIPPAAPVWSPSGPPLHPGPTGHYQPHPSQQSLLQLGYPQPPMPELRDVGRFSKLAVPCFKCKASSTQCDGRQPVCNSCQMRGTVCNYPSILRFDKQPVDSGWIQVQPTHNARNNVSRVQQPMQLLNNGLSQHPLNPAPWFPPR